MLKEIKIASTVVGTYVYSANNQRTKKTAGGNTVHYVYGPGGRLAGEYDNSGNLIREYVWLNAEPLAQIDAGTPEVLTYLHTDHLATPRYGTDSTGNVVWTWDSDAFGNGAPAGAATVNLRFPGQYFDAETGLHYNWNRYYNPATGRYISSDPIGLAGGLNTFNYANVSPVMHIDVKGLQEAGILTCTVGPNPVCVGSLIATCTKWVIIGASAGYIYYQCAMTEQGCKGPLATAINQKPQDNLPHTPIPGTVPREGPIPGVGEEEEEGRCRAVLESCRELCHYDGDIVPGATIGEIRQCIRLCMEESGCLNF